MCVTVSLGGRWWQPTTGFMTMHVCRCEPRWEVVAAHHRVHDYACVSLWALVGGDGSPPLGSWICICHLQTDCLVWDQLRSPTLDLWVWDLPLPFKVSFGRQPSRSKVKDNQLINQYAFNTTVIIAHGYISLKTQTQKI